MKIQDAAAMMLVAILWGYNFIASKIGVEHFPPIFFCAMRFLMLFVFMAPFIRPIPKGQRMAVAGIALSMGILHFAFMFTALHIATNISAVAIATQTQVPFAALLAMVFLKERVGWRRWSAIFVAFAGVALIGFDPRIFDEKLALILVLGAAFAFAVNQVIAATIRDIGIFNLQAWIALAAVPGLLVLSFFLEDGQWPSVAGAGLVPWSALAYSCIGASVIGHGIVYKMLRRYPVSATAPYMLLAPVIAVLFGILIWGDQVTWPLIVGGALTIGGVGVITLRSAVRQPVLAMQEA